jgi:hypothetical protein
MSFSYPDPIVRLRLEGNLPILAIVETSSLQAIKVPLVGNAQKFQ